MSVAGLKSMCYSGLTFAGGAVAYVSLINLEYKELYLIRLVNLLKISVLLLGDDFDAAHPKAQDWYLIAGFQRELGVNSKLCHDVETDPCV